MTTVAAIETAKQRALDAVSSISDELVRLSHQIHEAPELAFKERQAYEALVAGARGHGFEVEEQAYGMGTCFRGERGRGPVTLAVCAEYDALPEIGHACGHNLIAACGLGGAIAAAAALDAGDARIVLLGTPAEEYGGGKIQMIKRGCFDDIDAALMAHPGPVDFVYGGWQGAAQADVQFFGKAAHQASSPENGLNALDAIVTAYNGVSQLRQHIRRDARLACIITKGGDATNVIPEHTAGRFSVRAGTMEYMQDLKRRVEACIEAGALATGCRAEVKWFEIEYAPVLHNRTMAEAYTRNGEALGRHFVDLSRESVGSTDMGNVSQVLPAIHPAFGIGNARPHTREFAEVAGTDGAQAAMLDAARMLATTAVDLALDGELLAEAVREFEARRGARNATNGGTR